MHHFHSKQAFHLECGQTLHGITIAYHVYGKLNDRKDNVVWVCHALTANSDASSWWPGVIGEGCAINPQQHYIICANILGSCYGTTGPLTTNPQTGETYYSSFPLVTIRDMVNAHILLRRHLGIEQIYLLMGGSMGGYQALEWCFMEKEIIHRVFLAATSARESAWGIAIHAAQRLAIQADSSWQDPSPTAGEKGVKAARAIGMLTYRNYGILVAKQTDPDSEKIDGFQAASYIEYQGDKLRKRFNAYCYWLLTKAMDSHHLARGRGGKLEAVLSGIQQPTLIMGINSDILCPVDEQKFLHAHLPHCTLDVIDSVYGHDGFMVESGKISACLGEWLSNINP